MVINIHGYLFKQCILGINTASGITTHHSNPAHYTCLNVCVSEFEGQKLIFWKNCQWFCSVDDNQANLQKTSHAGIWTRVLWVETTYPNQLDYGMAQTSMRETQGSIPEQKKHVVQSSCDSSVGRALDWRSKGPVFDPRLRHHFWKLH